MATITPTTAGRVPPDTGVAGDGALFTWTPVTQADTGAAIERGSYGDRSVHVKGTFGSGGTCLIEGSNDGVTFVTLKDSLGNAMSFTAEGIADVGPAVAYIRPRVSAGTGVSLTIIMFARK